MQARSRILTWLFWGIWLTDEYCDRPVGVHRARGKKDIENKGDCCFGFSTNMAQFGPLGYPGSTKWQKSSKTKVPKIVWWVVGEASGSPKSLGDRWKQKLRLIFEFGILDFGEFQSHPHSTSSEQLGPTAGPPKKTSSLLKYYSGLASLLHYYHNWYRHHHTIHVLPLLGPTNKITRTCSTTSSPLK